MKLFVRDRGTAVVRSCAGCPTRLTSGTRRASCLGASAAPYPTPRASTPSCRCTWTGSTRPSRTTPARDSPSSPSRHTLADVVRFE